MGLGIAQPWMLPWLLATVIPIVLAWLAMRWPRSVRFGATEFVARAARRQHVTRGGVSVPITAVRMAALAAAALAAARPFTEAIGLSPSAANGRAAEPRIECVVDEPGVDHDGTLAVRRAIEAVGTRQADNDPHGRPYVVVVSAAAAGRNASAAPTLIIVGDGTMPAEADARRIATAVSRGAALLVCVGPRFTAEPMRGRLSAWLDDLAGISVSGGPEPLPAAGIAIAPGIAPGMVESAGFGWLAGPTVNLLAPLLVRDAAGRGVGPPTVLARTRAPERPVLVEVRRGRGTVCVAAVPLSLGEPTLGAAAEPWSDLAAWPVFVPLVDRLVERLLTRASAAIEDVGPRRLSLAPGLLALACGLLLGDWMLSAASGGGRRGLEVAWRAVAALCLLALCFGPRAGERAAEEPGRADDPHRGIVVLLDRSPSMGRPAGAAAGPLERAVAALSGGGDAPLDRIARFRPVDILAVAADAMPLGRWGRDLTGRELESLSAVPPADRSSRVGDAVVEAVRGPTTGVRPAAIVVVSDGAITAGRDWSEAAHVARTAGVPLVVIPVAGQVEAGHAETAHADTTDAETGARSDTAPAPVEKLLPKAAEVPIRVLMVESRPRYEWRFLERVLAADPGFAVTTCFLEPAELAARDGRLEAGCLVPGTVAAWNAFDVVVLGDVPFGDTGTDGAAGRAESWRTLAETASDDGLGIAWSPGNRWWHDAAVQPTWLPAAPGGGRRPLGPSRLRVREGHAAGAWLPREPVDAELFAVLHPVTLAASARVLAVATPVRPGGALSGEPAPAIVVDRLGAGTVLLHLCETWRWSGCDTAAYGGYWRALLRRLAEPHRLAMRLVATLDVAPRQAQAGEHVRVEVVPTHAGIDLSGWHVELVAAPGHAPAATPVRRVQLLPDAGRRGTMTAVIDGLTAGGFTVRLVPPAELPAPPAAGLPSCEIIVVESEVERPGDRPDVGALVAAARDSAGEVVPVDELRTLPDRLEAVVPGDGTRMAAAGATSRWRLLPGHGFAHAAMLVAVAALTAAWWPTLRGRGEPAR